MGLLASIFTFAATEGEAEPSGTDLILPAIDELIWGAVAFLIVLFVLNKFAFPKLRETVEAREKQIQGDLEAAERAKSEAQQAKANYDKQIADARAEANRIIEEARQTADQLRKDLMTRAEAEVNELRQRSREDIDAAKGRAMSELRAEVSSLAIELAEKVVGRNLDAESNKALVDSFINEVAAKR